MIHAYLRRQLSQYLDGALPEKLRGRVDRHLEHCAACREELVELRGTVSLLRSLDALEPPGDFAERVIARLAASDLELSRFRRVRASLAGVLGSSWAPAFASVTVLVVAAAILRVEIDVKLPIDAKQPQLVAAAPAPFRFEPTPVSQPLATRRRFDAIPLWTASGLRRACLASPNDAQCHPFHQEMVSLALEDTRAFIDEVDSVPAAPRERLLGVLSSEAMRSGRAARIVSRLRSVDDPRAVRIVVRFERPVASRD